MPEISHSALDIAIIKETNPLSQQLFDGDNPAQVMRDLSEIVGDSYTQAGRDPFGLPPGHRGASNFHRHASRVFSAPLIYGIEQTLATLLRSIPEERLLRARATVELPPRLPAIDGYGTFTGTRRVFTYTASVWTNIAAESFFRSAYTRRGHWAPGVLKAFSAIDAVHAKDPDVYRHTKQFSNPELPDIWNARQNLTSHVASANVTTVNVLAPAGEHASLWTTGYRNPGAAVERAIRTLGWVARLPATTMDALFPNQTEDMTQSDTCAFEHNAARIAQGYIWSRRLFPTDAPGDQHFCPAANPFRPTGQPDAEPQDAATLRLRSVLPIARLFLWPRGITYDLRCAEAQAVKSGILEAN